MLLPLLLAGCLVTDATIDRWLAEAEAEDDDATERRDTGQGAAGGDHFGDYINTTDSPVGDLSGFSAGCPGWNDNDCWIEQEVEDGAETTEALAGALEEFERGDGVSGAELTTYATAIPDDGDSPVGQATSGSDGDFTGLATPRCTTATIHAEPTSDTWVPTSTVVALDPETTELDLVLWEETTLSVVPALLGVSMIEGRGLVTGVARGSDGLPVENGQVLLRNRSSGSISNNVEVRYFLRDYPNRDQTATSADGRWMVINAPPGDWLVELWVSDGDGGHLLMGQALAQSRADAVVQADLHVGYYGPRLPDGCLGPPAEPRPL